MSDTELETEDYAGNAELNDSEAIDGQQETADSTFLTGGDGCNTDGCQNAANEAETAWVKLVSAIPVVGQAAYLKCVAIGTAAPSQEEVQSMVGQIRPSDPDKYALHKIADNWQEFKQEFAIDESTAVDPILKSKMTELANGWQGNDFDGFAEQMETVFANCEQISNDLGDESAGIIGLLRQKGDEIFALQGSESGELPYPAPQYWTEDEGGLFTDPKIHVRAPFQQGGCEIAESCVFEGEGSTDQAMDLGGFDSEYKDELSQYNVDQTEYHLTRLKDEEPDADESTLRERAESLAEKDTNEKAGEDYNEANADYQSRANAQNESVVARWSDAETSTSEFTPTVESSRDTSFRDSSDGLQPESYSPPGGGDFSSNPTSAGTSGLNSPENVSNFGGGGGGGGGLGGSGGGTGLDSDNPWDSGGLDDGEDSSGGLAGGGGGLGTLPGTGPGTGVGGGGGMGGGTGLGPGSGLFGPAAGGGGMGGGMGGGRGAGGGMGKGQGLFGKAAGGGGKGAGGVGGGGKGAGGTGAGGRGAGGRGPGGGMMGGRGAAGGPEDEEGRETWLTEDDDIWGLLRDPDKDLYA